MEPELVFKALGDASRRKLLDLLFLKDGRSLSELEEYLPMTRFGVMKHLKILKEAGLVATRKSGRETLHYLNAVPIQMVYDRWVSKYSKGWARSLTELKYDLEDTNDTLIHPLPQVVPTGINKLEARKMAEAALTEDPNQVFEIYIRTTPEKLWQAITDGELTKDYYFGTRVESDWKPQSEYKYVMPDGTVMLNGKVVESDPPTRLVMTFVPHWDPSMSEPTESRVTYEIESKGDACKLTLVHEGLKKGEAMTEGIFHGWSQILSSLKTLLETGTPFQVGP
ncbi:MAG: ArsR/SmtB family transcription factor [Blastocatellia bacterium]